MFYGKISDEFNSLRGVGWMTKVSLQELLLFAGKIRKLHTGSELLLAYELDKYLKMMAGKSLDLSNVTIAKELLSGEHFSFIVNHMQLDIPIDRTMLADISKVHRRFFTQTVEGVAFKKVSDDEVVYDYYHDINANKIMRDDHSSAAYVSLAAYLIVSSYLKGKEMPKLIIDHERYNQREMEYADIFILKDYGNRILKDKVEIRYSTAWGYQPEWEAFVMYHRQRGEMNREYSIPEKFRYLKKNFEIGDVVLLYQRRPKGARGSISRLESCYPAVIRYYDSNVVRLDYYPIIQTKLTRYIELREVDERFLREGKESIYTDHDYERFVVSSETLPLVDVGVGTHTFLESTFFIKPLDTDGSYQYFENPQGGYDKVWLSTLDTIYAVFEDRGVDYNRERFLDTYFRPYNRIPVYDQLVNRAGVR